MISMKYNTITLYYPKSALKGKKGWTECCLIRRKNYLEDIILIRSDLKFFETFKILRWNLLTVNGDNKSKQIYKMI